MADNDKDSKTEAPTEKKIRDALEKGQTAFSREAPLFASLLAAAGFMALFAKPSAMIITDRLSYFMSHAHEIHLDTGLDATAVTSALFSPVMTTILPLFLVLIVAGIVASTAQNAPRMVRDRIAPKFSNVSPASGWTRIFGKRGFIEFAKSLVKIGFAFAIVIFFMRDRMEALVGYVNLHPLAMLQMLETNIVYLLFLVCGFMAAVTAVDIFASRFLWYEDLRMTRQEIKEEHKQAEGDPMVKARIRSIARARSRSRMMSAVPTATLVVANPTHFAVAMRYDPARDAAPVVVAKGTDDLALRIRAIAEANDVPVFERVELARSLYKVVKVDQIIPQAFFKAVAELVRYVHSRK
ncbi:flagellar biosynthesis protein FlhB [Zhengella mangrovi]|uniref:Flagellar biosynthesis protein FlhB n=1 Tax=Zhengella mangrovi TaxID=1982044 RepID=A0A2G1QJV5_9HYPH|nr:flagellar type III secretion system protein FlhB [Zhengella mangrovi]PHP65730.1 flagellar biosynthesis protein FlhB [Zhengella mangrovi]